MCPRVIADYLVLSDAVLFLPSVQASNKKLQKGCNVNFDLSGLWALGPFLSLLDEQAFSCPW